MLPELFSTLFENNKLKNELRKPATNMTSSYNLFWRPHLLSMQEILRPYL